MTKHDAVTAYFQPKAEVLAGQYLGFNFSDDYSGISLVTNYSDKLLKKYLWGAEKEYGCSIVIVQPYSTDADDLNLTAMNFAQAFMDWLEEENKKHPLSDQQMADLFAKRGTKISRRTVAKYREELGFANCRERKE